MTVKLRPRVLCSSLALSVDDVPENILGFSLVYLQRGNKDLVAVRPIKDPKSSLLFTVASYGSLSPSVADHLKGPATDRRLDKLFSYQSPNPSQAHQERLSK